MSGFFSTPTSRAGYTIRTFLHRIGVEHKIVESRYKLNRFVLIPFLKSVNLPYQKINKRYKGINTAELQNSILITENPDTYRLFRQWCKQNVYRINKEYVYYVSKKVDHVPDKAEKASDT